MIDSFEKVWEKIDGENKSYMEILETLQDEISHRGHLASKLHQSGDFRTLTQVEQERNVFAQVQYGIQDLSYPKEPEELKEAGLDESDIWKAARAKGLEIRNREKIEERELIPETPASRSFPGHSPVFYGTSGEDREAFRESHRQNVECAQKLEKALGDHFEDFRLDMSAVFEDMEEYSSERVSVILANTIRLREDDGRFSAANREWAKDITLPASGLNGHGEELVKSHSVKVDGFTKAFREMEISKSRDVAILREQTEPELTGHSEEPRAQESQTRESPPQGPNMAEVQAAEMKASIIQGLNRSADGLSRVEGQDVGYAEEGYVTAADQVKYEAQRARTTDGEIKGRGNEKDERSGPRPMENPRIGQRATFRPHDGKAELTGNVVATDERTVTLQCGSKKIPAIREKGNFFEAPPLKREQTKEFAKDQARQLMGEKSDIFFAQDRGTWKGEIIGLTPTYAIQKVNGETAVLHRLKDLGVQDKDGLVREGQEVSIVKDETGVSISPWSKEREEKEKVRERQKSRGSQSR